jgi:hypothetical protein
MEIRELRLRFLFLGFLCAVLSGSCLLMPIFSVTERAGWILNGLLGISFAVAAAFLLYLFIKEEPPILVLSASGVEFCRLGLGLVQWEEIVSVWISGLRGEGFRGVGIGLAFRFRDAKSIGSRLTEQEQREEAFWQPGSALGDIYVSFLHASPSFDEALAYIRGRGVPGK